MLWRVGISSNSAPWIFKGLEHWSLSIRFPCLHVSFASAQVHEWLHSVLHSFIRPGLGTKPLWKPSISTSPIGLHYICSMRLCGHFSAQIAWSEMFFLQMDHTARSSKHGVLYVVYESHIYCMLNIVLDGVKATVVKRKSTKHIYWKSVVCPDNLHCIYNFTIYRGNIVLHG